MVDNPLGLKGGLAYLSGPGPGRNATCRSSPDLSNRAWRRPQHRAMDPMTSLRPVRGTHDIVGETALRHRKVVETGRAVAARYGYAEVATPVFEFTEVFARTLGETSDIVTKEMYAFEDRGGDKPDPASGIHRRHRARVHCRLARPAAADQAVRERPDVPLRLPELDRLRRRVQVGDVGRMGQQGRRRRGLRDRLRPEAVPDRSEARRPHGPFVRRVHDELADHAVPGSVCRGDHRRGDHELGQRLRHGGHLSHQGDRVLRHAVGRRPRAIA